MAYEMEIVIRRSDPQTLADDFQAVTTLLIQRKAVRAEEQEAPQQPRHQPLGTGRNARA